MDNVPNTGIYAPLAPLSTTFVSLIAFFANEERDRLFDAPVSTRILQIFPKTNAVTMTNVGCLNFLGKIFVRIHLHRNDVCHTC